jgi:hypothetical protein
MLIIGIFVLYLIYSHFVNIYLDTVGKDHYDDDTRVYDLCHTYLPNYEKYEFIGNIYIIIILLFVFKSSKYISIIFDLIAFIIPIYFIRSILTLITVLPKSSECNYNQSFAFINGGCYDKIFSGHSAFLFILTLLLNKYKIINFATLIILNIINVSIILLTRTHYTIDVIVSFLVCYIIYTNNIRL